MFLIYFAILQRLAKADEPVCVSPPSDYSSAEVINECGKEITDRTGSSTKAVYISSCTFQNLDKKYDGAAIYMTHSSKKYNCTIYNCLFENCKTTKTGGAIRVTVTPSSNFINITKCTFKSNTAKTGGAIYFYGIFGIVSECTFYNNIATDGTSSDFYYSSKDTLPANAAEYLLVEKCEFIHDVQDSTKSMFYLNWGVVADLQIKQNTVRITGSEVTFFGFISSTKDSRSTLVCEDNLITQTILIVPDDLRSSDLGTILIPGFAQLPDSETPTTPDVPSNPNCPSAPYDHVDIEKHSGQVNRYVYGCEKTRDFRLDARQCVLTIYLCTFNSVISGKANGGAIYLSTTLSSNTDKPTPKGDCAIHNCTFNECSGGSGGAMYLQMQDSDRFTGIINCTFTNNKATNDEGLAGGGALYIDATYITVESCTFVDNQANAKGQQIYYKVFETTIDTEYPFIITNCTLLQNKVSSSSALIFLQWNERADFFFNYNRIKLADNLIAYLFEETGDNLEMGNLSCKLNALLPSHDLLCDKNTSLYKRIRYDFQNADAPKEDILIDDINSCKNSNENRCQNINNDNMYEHVNIKISKFNGFENEDNGGAVYLINTGVTCIGTEYSNCKSKTAGGGAIYIYNDIEKVNYATFEDVSIKSCSAVFGGAAYIYSNTDKNEVLFKGSTFRKNVAQTSGENNFFGGGALYLTVKVGNIEECTFINNKGGTVKVNNNFDDKPPNNKVKSKVLKEKNTQMKQLSILGCKFETEKNSKYPSLLFVNNQNKNKNEVKRCVFNGKLAKGTYHIDAEKSESVHVDSCNFSSMENAFNSNVIIGGTNNKVIGEKSSFYSMKFYISVVMLAVVGCVAIVSLIIKKKGGQNNEEENDAENHEVSLISLDNENKL